MLDALLDRAKTIKPDRIQSKQTVGVVPILGPSFEKPNYRLLKDDVLESVQVTEATEGGSVPTLKVENTLDESVFLMDGQELVGAKQNRILNTDVMVPAKSTITIPVSCVEQGRWHYKGRHFRSGGSAHYSTRRGKSSRVHKSLQQKKAYDADQGAVWNEVQMCLSGSSSHSKTAALSAAYQNRQGDLKSFRDSLELPEEAVGLAVFRGDRFRGLDLFDRHSTMSFFWDSLIDSYVIDWIGEPFDANEPAKSVEESAINDTLQHAGSGEWESFNSPGEGRDYRLKDHETLCGSALLCEDNVVVHLQLFPKS